MKTKVEDMCFKTEQEEARFYGFKGCLCSSCVTKRILLEYDKAQNPNKEIEFKEKINQIKEIISITEIAKRRYKLEVNNGMTKCQFHEEKTPSMMLYDKSATFFCFGCGAKGDVIEFIEKMEEKNGNK